MGNTLSKHGAVGLIGVDVGAHWLCAAQVELSNPPRLWAAARLPRFAQGALSNEEGELFARTLARAGFIGREVVVMAPDAALMTALVELPPRGSKAPLAILARNELARIHRKEHGAFEAAMWDLPVNERAGNVTQAMVVGLDDSSAEELLASLEAPGLRVCAVDARACAIARACDPLTRPLGLTGIVDVGWEACHVVLVHASAEAGKTLVYERRLPECGLQVVYKMLAEKLGMSLEACELATCGDPEACELDDLGMELLRATRTYLSEYLDLLVPDLQRSLSYAVQRFPQDVLHELLFVGEGATCRGLRERTEAAMGCPARIAAPKDLAGLAADSTFADESSLVSALGLATFRSENASRLFLENAA